MIERKAPFIDEQSFDINDIAQLNTLLIGSSGTGKSHSVIGSDIMQANDSYVVNDPTGKLYKQYGGFLESMGYNVKCFNLKNINKSDYYNPLVYIKNERDVVVFVSILLQKEITDPIEIEQASEDSLWTNSRTMFLHALVAYLCLHGTNIEKNISGLIQLIKAADIYENDYTDLSQLDLLFAKAEKEEGETSAVKNYKKFKHSSKNTQKAVIISCTALFQKFEDKAAKIIGTDTLKLDRIGEEKTALFIINPTPDTEFCSLVSMLYSHIFDSLYGYCEYTAKYCACIVDESNNVLKTFRAQDEEDAKNALDKAESFLSQTRNGKVISNKKEKRWEILTENDELAGYRGSKKLADEALSELKAGRVVHNSDLSKRGNRLPVHVRFLLGEFANTKKIPYFTKIITTLRGLNMSVMISLQSMHQLAAMYEDEDDQYIITRNCDCTICLGGYIDTETSDWIFKIVSRRKDNNISAANIRSVPASKCIVITPTCVSIKTKCVAEEHPNWKLIKINNI